jgi:hypothetical protein
MRRLVIGDSSCEAEPMALTPATTVSLHGSVPIPLLGFGVFPALRKSAESDGGEKVPVRVASVEQRPDVEGSEPTESEGDPLDAFDEVGDRFGGPVGESASMPGHDLVVPAEQGAAEGAHLDREGGVLEVLCEAGHELVGEVGVADGVDLADDFFGVPGGLD